MFLISSSTINSSGIWRGTKNFAVYALRWRSGSLDSIQYKMCCKVFLSPWTTSLQKFGLKSAGYPNTFKNPQILSSVLSYVSFCMSTDSCDLSKWVKTLLTNSSSSSGALSSNSTILKCCIKGGLFSPSTICLISVVLRLGALLNSFDYLFWPPKPSTCN